MIPRSQGAIDTLTLEHAVILEQLQQRLETELADCNTKHHESTELLNSVHEAKVRTRILLCSSYQRTCVGSILGCATPRAQAFAVVPRKKNKTTYCVVIFATQWCVD